MQKNLFKAETNVYYTSWDLNCRTIVPHTPAKNRFERKIKRLARRRNKIKLKNYLTNQEG